MSIKCIPSSGSYGDFSALQTRHWNAIGNVLPVNGGHLQDKAVPVHVFPRSVIDFWRLYEDLRCQDLLKDVTFHDISVTAIYVP